MNFKLIKIVPSLVTYTSLLLGLYVIVFFNKDNITTMLLIAIPLAVLCDAMDGFLARKLKVTSDFGFNLDSLADMVSFGIAPTIMLIRFYGDEPMKLIIFVLITIGGAFRLARFNSNPTTHSKNPFYEGLPIPFSGLTVPLLIFLNTPLYISIIVIIILSSLMVSKLKIPKPF